MGKMKQRNVMCDDETWEAMRQLAERNRRTMAAEVRLAFDVHQAVSARGEVEKVLNGPRR